MNDNLKACEDVLTKIKTAIEKGTTQKILFEIDIAKGYIERVSWQSTYKKEYDLTKKE